MVLSDNFKALAKLYYNPIRAMNDIIDQGSLLFAMTVAAVATLVFYLALAIPMLTVVGNLWFVGSSLLPSTHQAAPAQTSGSTSTTADEAEEESPPIQPGFTPTRMLYLFYAFLSSPMSILSWVAALTLLYVPASIIVGSWFIPTARIGILFQQHYGSLLACTCMAWAAAFLPGSVLLLVGPVGKLFLAPFVVSLGTLYFAMLMVCALRVNLGSEYQGAILTVLLSWLSLLLAPIFSSCLSYVMLPWIAFYLYGYIRGEANFVSTAFSGQQSFRRYLEASTINPCDAEAHYQLGLIHQKRRQYSDAIERFQRSVEIDPNEIDAHYQLGRIAREQKRFQDAITHFDAVVTRDEKHCRYEIWREIGATYFEAGMCDDARPMLERYVQQREFDPEGLYYLGASYAGLGLREQARQVLEQCLEAVRTTPHYRRGEVRQFQKLANEKLASLA